MMIEERLSKLESMIQTLLDRSTDRADSQKIEALIEKVSAKKPEKEYYSIAEAAEIVGRSRFQVRTWCRQGRIKAKKRATGRGPGGEWVVSHDELKAYQSLGLRKPHSLT